MNELIFFFNKVLVSGAVLGSIYALGAIGVTLIFGILRFAHFAHGDMMTMGAFFAFLLALGFAAMGITTPIVPTGFVVLPVAMVITAVIALGLDKGFYAPLRQARREAGDAADRLDRRDADDPGPDPAVLRHRRLHVLRRPSRSC